MILNLKINNFKHIKESVEINFLKNNNIAKVIHFNGVSNSGKTNTLKSIQYIQQLVTSNDVPFFLEKNTIEKNQKELFLEITFLYESKEYKYGFRILENKIKEEYLYENNKEIFFISNSNANELYLHNLTSKNISEAINVLQFFKKDIFFLKMDGLNSDFNNAIDLIQNNAELKYNVIKILNNIYKENTIKDLNPTEVLRRKTVINQYNEKETISTLVTDVELNYENHKTYLLQSESGAFFELFIMATHIYNAILNKNTLIMDNVRGYILDSDMEKFIKIINDDILKTQFTQILGCSYYNKSLLEKIKEYDGNLIFNMFIDENRNFKICKYI